VGSPESGESLSGVDPVLRFRTAREEDGRAVNGRFGIDEKGVWDGVFWHVGLKTRFGRRHALELCPEVCFFMENRGDYAPYFFGFIHLLYLISHFSVSLFVSFFCLVVLCSSLRFC